jgi:hypothetical protein
MFFIKEKIFFIIIHFLYFIGFLNSLIFYDLYNFSNIVKNILNVDPKNGNIKNVLKIFILILSIFK